jgi:guanylate kinase
MEAAGAFIETRQKDGVYHGTSYTELQRIKSTGKIPIIEVDCEGAD